MRVQVMWLCHSAAEAELLRADPPEALPPPKAPSTMPDDALALLRLLRELRGYL